MMVVIRMAEELQGLVLLMFRTSSELQQGPEAATDIYSLLLFLAERLAVHLGDQHAQNSTDSQQQTCL
jgi:hypothetical protein